MTHDVFTKAWQADAFQKANHKAYLYRSAHNLLIDHWRKHKDTVSLDEPVTEDGATLADLIEDKESAAPLELADRKGTLRVVAGALHKLPPRLKDVLILRFVNELSVRETAVALEISESNVRVLQHRGLKALRKELP